MCSTRPARHRLRSVVAGLVVALWSMPALAQESPRVFLINSYHRQYRWTDQHVEGVRDGLAASVDEERLFIEYMDSRRMIDDPEHLALLAAQYAHKLEALPPDLVMVSDDSALDFALAHRDALFPDAPIVFYGLNAWSPEEAEEIPNATGVLEGLEVEGNLELIRQLQPDVRRIVIVSDQTSLGLGMTQVARDAIPRHRSPSLEIDVWDAFTFDELVERMAASPPHTAYLILGIHRDRAGRYFSWQRDTRVLTSRSRAPVYAMWGFVLGDGVVGGMMNDGYEHGHEAAAIAARVLAGTPADDIPVVPSARYRPRVDFAAMQRFRIDPSRLPPGSEMIGRPTSFYEQHRELVWGTLAIIAGLLGAIAYLLRSNARVRGAESALRASEASLRVEVKERTHAEEAMRFLAEASRALAESLDVRVTIEQLTRLALPWFADWCMVDLVEDGRVERIASSHVDPEKEGLLRALRDRYPPQPGSPQPAARVLRSGRPLLLEDLGDEVMTEHSVDQENVRLVRALGARSAIAVPLVVHERMLGVITFVSAAPDRRYDANDLALAAELARRAATALENARLYREAQDAIRLRDEFLMVASHELRTPLTPIQLVLGSLQKNGSLELPTRVEKGLGIVRNQTKRLTNLVDEMLSVAEVERGIAIELGEVDLVALARAVAAGLAPDLERSGSTLSIDARRPVVGRWDARGLERIVGALLSNAVKFGNGEPIEITIDEGAGVASIAVRDHGIGIAPDRLPHVFERFGRGVSALHYGGFGLGLYIASAIVSAHGGTLRAESAPGVGSTFTAVLPLTAVRQAGPRGARRPPELGAAPRGQP